VALGPAGDSARGRVIRDATSSDYPAILALNLASEHLLAPLGLEHLTRLHAMAERLRVVELDDTVVAFLLVLREGAAYDSPNYRYFAARQDKFLYVDRIVIGDGHRSGGWGSALYQELFQDARARGVPSVTCEIDVEPPNEASRRFHARFGFQEIGRQWVAEGRKQVSLQEARVLSRTAPAEPSGETA
jgi:predicted GNAT superfamily acetyltransferase